MASKRARNRKGRITISADPAEMKRKAEEARLKVEEQRRQAEKQPAGFGVNEDALEMAVNADVQVKRDKGGRIKSAWRTNPFVLLRGKGTISDDEANAGEDMVAIYAASKGLEGAPEDKPYWQYDPEGYGPEDRKRFHIRLFAGIMARLSESSRKIAEAIAYAMIEEDRPMVWAGIVQRVTGAATMQRQSERFVMMCEELVNHIPAVYKQLLEERDRRAA